MRLCLLKFRMENRDKYKIETLIEAYASRKENPNNQEEAFCFDLLDKLAEYHRCTFINPDSDKRPPLLKARIDLLTLSISRQLEIHQKESDRIKE